MKGWQCRSPPTVYTFEWTTPGINTGCRRKRGHPGNHDNGIVTWSEVQEPRLHPHFRKASCR
jgi:hypothetical protein